MVQRLSKIYQSLNNSTSQSELCFLEKAGKKKGVGTHYGKIV